MSVNAVTDGYKKQVQDNLHIFNGIEYLRPGHGVKGTPFFLSDSLLTGAVFYDGNMYENLPMHYDVVSDDVVINNYSKNNEIKLVPEKLSYFLIAQHLFVRITADSATPSFIKTGFYERLYDGKMSLFARYQKSPKLSNTGDYTTLYAEYNNYYVLLNNTFYHADSKNEFLDLMADKKDAVKRFMKSNKIKINNKNPEAAMIQVAAYYSQLKN
ncbi:MAG: hypothetical protein QM726_05245 [Chitinophagaceae bacterium]